MRTRPIGRFAAIVLLVAPTTLPAQEPGADLATLIAVAERNNPEIQAASRAAEAAEARVPAAGALPDPTLGVGVMNFPVADPSLGRDMMTMTTVQLGERFPWPGKLVLREDVAHLGAAAARWEVELTRQSVGAEVKAAYYRIYFLDRALEVTGRNESLMADFARLTSTRYGVGEGTQSDVLRAQVERTRLSDQIVALAEQRESAVARLNALLGRATDTPIQEPELPGEVRIAALEDAGPSTSFQSVSLSDVLPGGSLPDEQADPGDVLPSVRELQAIGLANSPMVQAHVSRVAARERSVSLARKAWMPDFDVAVAYSHRPDFSDFVNLMVSVPLPIFRGRKQDQAVIEEAASLAEQEALHHAMVDDMNAEIATLAAGLRRTREQLVLLNEGILPQAEASLASATASYRVGTVDFLTLLDSQVTLYRHELDYHRLLSDFAADLAELERVVGTEVLR